jgi:hypothetical protein
LLFDAKQELRIGVNTGEVDLAERSGDVDLRSLRLGRRALSPSAHASSKRR